MSGFSRRPPGLCFPKPWEASAQGGSFLPGGRAGSSWQAGDRAGRAQAREWVTVQAQQRVEQVQLGGGPCTSGLLVDLGHSRVKDALGQGAVVGAVDVGVVPVLRAGQDRAVASAPPGPSSSTRHAPAPHAWAWGLVRPGTCPVMPSQPQLRPGVTLICPLQEEASCHCPAHGGLPSCLRPQKVMLASLGHPPAWGWGSLPRHVFPTSPSSRCASFRAVHQPSASLCTPCPGVHWSRGKDQAVTEQRVLVCKELVLLEPYSLSVVQPQAPADRAGRPLMGLLPPPSQMKKAIAWGLGPKQAGPSAGRAKPVAPGSAASPSSTAAGQEAKGEPQAPAAGFSHPGHPRGRGGARGGGPDAHRAPWLQDPREALPGWADCGCPPPLDPKKDPCPICLLEKPFKFPAPGDQLHGVLQPKGSQCRTTSSVTAGESGVRSPAGQRDLWPLSKWTDSS